MSDESDCSLYTYSPDFKNFIDKDGGSSLFYLRIHPLNDVENTNISKVEDPSDIFRNEYKRMSLKQRDKGILSKLTPKKLIGYDFEVIERRNYKQAEGVIKELKIVNKSANYSKNNRRKIVDKSNLFEILFNASLIRGPDNKKLLIDKINLPSVFEKDFSVGDIIKSIDDDIITIENINHVVQKIIYKKSFKIVAQGYCKDEYNESTEEIKITRIEDVIQHKEKLFRIQSESHELVFSLLIIVKDNEVIEDADNFKTIFSYPPIPNNFLHKQKGSFLTLASIVKSSFDDYPIVTSIKIHNTTFFLTYTIKRGSNEYIFLGFNSFYTNLFDVKCVTNNFMKFLNYVYLNFASFNDFDFLNSICEIVKIQLLKKCSDIMSFEQAFSYPKFVPLPKEIILRINDALSELEAMDYRNWNESLMELFGKFNVIGSCLFYKTSLICSHFNNSDIENIELFIHHFSLKFLYEACYVKEIAIWRRVYPTNYIFNEESNSSKNKLFLLIVARANLMISVLLEENSYNLYLDMEAQSSNYLINFLEEMEGVMDHLNVVGIENLARIWIDFSKRPKCKNPLENFEKSLLSEHQNLKNIQEEDEESQKDYESHVDSQKSSSVFENEDVFYKNFEDIIPQTLTFGPENVLYHYIQLDFTDGIILSNINLIYSKSPYDILIDIFRRCCLSIHEILQNTIKFNNLLLSKENKVTNRTMMLPKEQGMLIEIEVGNEQLNFWVIGRLFGNKELYVCYDSNTPQNMAEIAFRLALNCIG